MQNHTRESLAVNGSWRTQVQPSEGGQWRKGGGGPLHGFLMPGLSRRVGVADDGDGAVEDGGGRG